MSPSSQHHILITNSRLKKGDIRDALREIDKAGNKSCECSRFWVYSWLDFTFFQDMCSLLEGMLEKD